ncbi:MAG: hypothetical protein LBO09_01350 [Candidatus Peribacteria bacterium]|jgi:hypothetical protein|nr:hypothetical protein [Candidatus Peribacteria bacterium]
MRFLCFLNAKNIIEKSYLYQEYMAETIEVEIKKNGNKIREKRLAQYY